MTDKQLDDLFKKSLEKHSSDVPDDMWARINSDNRKRRRTVILTRSMLFLLLSFSAGISWYVFINSNNYQEINKTMADQQPLNNTSSSDNRKMYEKAMSQKVHDSSDNKLLLSGSRNNKLNRAFKAYDNERSESNDHAFIGNGLIDNNRLNDNNVHITGNSRNANNNPKNELTSSKAGISKDSSTLKDSGGIAAGNEKEEIKESTNDKIAIELYASPQLPFTDIASGNSSYENVLKNSIHSRLSFNIGARFRVSITKELSAKIGVQLDRISEKVTFKDSALSSNSTYNNQYKSINVPLLLSYEIPWHRMINASFTSGIILNIHSSYKGAIPSVYGQSMNIDNGNIYNKNTGVSLYVSLSLSKEIGNKFSLFAEPYFCYPVKNMADQFQSFKQRINTTGISFGVRHNLLRLDK